MEFIKTGWTAELATRLLLKRHALHSAGLQILWRDQLLEWKSDWAEDLKMFAVNIDKYSEEAFI